MLGLDAMGRACAILTTTVLCLLVDVPRANAYSVLAHEAAIDVAWDAAIKPVLLQRFPKTSAEGLRLARSYAYGGAVIQDLGYYPFGSKFFSNLLHYTRSGDFVEALVSEARDVNELAFAVGALAHYTNDTTGHPRAVNLAVPLVFPKLKAKFGDTVTYVQAPAQHVIVEFSFDVVQVAAGAYPPDTYRAFIGFRVAEPLLERAFAKTYGLEMDDVFASQQRAISTYRYAVSQIIPELTKAAWRDKEEEIARLTPGLQRNARIFHYRRADFERDYGHDYDKPGWVARLLGAIYRIVPKIGPLKPLSFRIPSPEAQAMFAQSFREATIRFRAALSDIRAGRLSLNNTDFDTGRQTRHGEYQLADETYVELLQKLASHDFGRVPDALRRDVLAFYGPAPQPSPANKRERKDWHDVRAALVALKRAR